MRFCKRLQLGCSDSTAITLLLSWKRVDAEVKLAIVRRIHYASIGVQGDRSDFLTLFRQVNITVLCRIKVRGFVGS